MNPGRPWSHLSRCFWFLCGILFSNSFFTADKFDESELLLKWFRLYLKCNYMNSVKNIILMLGREGLIIHVTLWFCRPKDTLINLIHALNLVRPVIVQNQVIFIFLYILKRHFKVDFRVHLNRTLPLLVLFCVWYESAVFRCDCALTLIFSGWFSFYFFNFYLFIFQLSHSAFCW